MTLKSNSVLAAMRLYNAPETREEYILWAFLGEVDPGAELDPELEAELPPQFRRDALDEADEDNIQ
jgi:hypothetical protein